MTGAIPLRTLQVAIVFLAVSFVHMPDRMSEDVPDRMSEDLPDRMPDRSSR